MNRYVMRNPRLQNIPELNCPIFLASRIACGPCVKGTPQRHYDPVAKCDVRFVGRVLSRSHQSSNTLLLHQNLRPFPRPQCNCPVTPSSKMLRWLLKISMQSSQVVDKLHGSSFHAAQGNHPAPKIKSNRSIRNFPTCSLFARSKSL